MTASKAYTLWCDAPDCLDWTVASGIAQTAAEVRREARREGWGRSKGQDLCPHHLRMTALAGALPTGQP